MRGLHQLSDYAAAVLRTIDEVPGAGGAQRAQVTRTHARYWASAPAFVIWGLERSGGGAAVARDTRHCPPAGDRGRSRGRVRSDIMSSRMLRVRFSCGDDAVARIVMAAPKRHNAIDPLWVSEFIEAVDRCASDPRARVVLISAEGPAFSVGGDLLHFTQRADDLAAALTEMVPPFHDALAALAHLPLPVVVAVQGVIAGGALGVACAGDLVVAADDARFATAFDRLALSGDGGSSWWLPQLVGMRRAQQMIIGGRVVDAATALDWGLITEVVPAGDLAACAEALVTRLAAGPTYAYGRMRGLLQAAATTPLRDHLVEEARVIIGCGEMPDAREGVIASTAKRAPRFGGRAKSAVGRTTVESVYAALATGDRAALVELLDPGFTARFAEGMPAGAGLAEGATEAIAHWWAIGAHWAVHAEPQSFVECADGRLLVIGRYRGTRRDGDGSAIDAAFTHLWSAAGGRLIGLEQVTDTARWA